MWNKYHTQTKTETDIRTELCWLFSAQKWHWKYCSRIPLEYWPSRGLWMSRALSRVHYSDSWRLHKCTDLCRQMHRSVSMSYVKICVDVTQYVKLLDLAKSQSGVTHLESIWSGQVIFEDGQSHRALTYFGVSRIRSPWTREVFKTMLGLLIHLRGRSLIKGLSIY